MATRSQKSRATKLSKLRAKARALGCVIKAKASSGKSKNVRYTGKVRKRVYTYKLK